MSKRIVCIPDMQVPDHDRAAVAALTLFVRDYQPDELLCVGDESDSPEPSRWNKGYAGEFAGTLQKNLDLTAETMRAFKEALGDRPFHTMRSNHGDRVATYLNRYAPALASLRALDYATLLRYAENGITYHTRPYAFAPGWVLAHGDEGGLRLTAGGTALGLARRFGRSVVCGHTHRLGIQHDHDMLNGRLIRPLWGVESGHLMDPRKADYLKAGSANWQQGFTIFHVNKRTVQPTLVPIIDRSFTVEGKAYTW